jgi:8-oxo-dGTP pyrophosphatase MutT (NUDIX family)
MRDRLRGEKLLEALASYRPEDPRDAQVLGRLRDFAAGPECFLRANPVGHVTASAIVAAEDGATFLLVRHAKLGGWLQPGGHVDPEDESTFAAALREVREETGLERFGTPIGRAILDLDVHEIPALVGEPAHLHFDVKHLLIAEFGAKPFPDASWFSCDEIPSLDRDGSLTRAVRKAQDRLDVAARTRCSR